VPNQPGGNLDRDVVADFGREWSTFDQADLDAHELERIFDRYFALFPWNILGANAEGFDLGCGSGRWARICAARIDPSRDALAVARRNLSTKSNCIFHEAGVDAIPLEDGSMDFGYSLGVLHHAPDTPAGIKHCVQKLKRGAPFLLYLYYAFDNRPPWFKRVWRASDLLRRMISILPYPLKYTASQVIALTVYLPLARAARVLEKSGRPVEHFPLAAYRDKSFYTMRTDAYDRFGTRLEKRFTREQIERMMTEAGLERIRFSEAAPFWCALGYKAR
jgi:SAM-dependent methyltransferase